MSKEPEILDNTKITPTVELHLTKSDLVDMVVAEQEEAIEQKIDELDNKIKETRDKITTCKESLKDLLIKSYSKKYAKAIRSAEKFCGKKAELSVSLNTLLTRQEYLYKMYGKSKHKISKSLQLPQAPIPEVFEASVEQKDYSHSMDKYSFSTWKAREKIEEKDYKSNPKYQELVELYDNLSSLLKEHTDMNVAMDGIENMGKRAKARMVREILSGSKQGQQLLKSIPRLNSSKLLKQYKV